MDERLRQRMEGYFSVRGRTAHFIKWAERNYGSKITNDQISKIKKGHVGFSSFSRIVFTVYLDAAESFNG